MNGEKLRGTRGEKGGKENLSRSPRGSPRGGKNREESEIPFHDQKQLFDEQTVGG